MRRLKVVLENVQNGNTCINYHNIKLLIPYASLQGTPFPIQQSDMGFDKGDYVMNQASKVLSLIYKNFRSIKF